MDKKKSIITIFLLAIIFLIAWATITFLFSDDSEDLGGGFTYYSEQKMINGKFQIPPTIQEYKYDSEKDGDFYKLKSFTIQSFKKFMFFWYIIKRIKIFW